MASRLASAQAPSQQGLAVTLSAALLGAFSSGLGAQMVNTAIADLQGAIGASADEASWIPTAYAAGEIVIIPVSAMLMQALGLRRLMIWLCGAFILSALLSAASVSLEAEIALRVIQGMLGGAFGVVAFGMIFRVFDPRHRALGLTLLTFCQTCPSTVGAVLAGWITETPIGWPAVYYVEAGMALMVLVEILASTEHQCFTWKPIIGLDWLGYSLLASGLALLLLVLSQGNRRFWFESPMIMFTALVAAGLLVGFLILDFGREGAIIDFRVIGRRSFGAAVVLNILFRFGLLETGYVLPQFLSQIQGYRPAQIADVLLVTGIAQVLAFPLSYGLMRTVSPRLPIFIGLLMFAAGGLVDAFSTSLTAADQFWLSQIVLGAAPALFVAPLLVIGTKEIRPTEGASASTFFNGSRSLGQQLGTAFLATLIRYREGFHSAALTAQIGTADGRSADRFARLQDALGRFETDPARQAAEATAVLANQVRLQAFVLSYNDAFLAIAAVMCAGAVFTLLLPPSQRADG